MKDLQARLKCLCSFLGSFIDRLLRRRVQLNARFERLPSHMEFSVAATSPARNSFRFSRAFTFVFTNFVMPLDKSAMGSSSATTMPLILKQNSSCISLKRVEL